MEMFQQVVDHAKRKYGLDIVLEDVTEFPQSHFDGNHTITIQNNVVAEKDGEDQNYFASQACHEIGHYIVACEHDMEGLVDYGLAWGNDNDTDITDRHLMDEQATNEEIGLYGLLFGRQAAVYWYGGDGDDIEVIMDEFGVK